MKNIIVLLSVVFLTSSLSLFAQQLKPEMVPQRVIDRLNHVFPQSVDLPVSWVKEKGNYKATLTIMDAPAIMVIDSLGNQKRVERRINETYLPENAKSYLKKLDPAYQVVTVTKIVDEKERTTFQTAVKIKSNFTFDKDGKVVVTK